MLFEPYAIPLTALPELRHADPPAHLSARRRDGIDSARAALGPHQFDGPVMMSGEYSASRIGAWRATYAWALAHAADPAAAPDCAGQLGVALLVGDEAGRFLWQRRGAGILEPGTWTHSAQGGVDPGEGLVEAVLREACEETGLGAGELTGLAPRMLFVEPQSLSVVFTAIADPTRPLPAPSAEVAELRWARPQELASYSPRWGHLRRLAGELGLLG